MNNQNGRRFSRTAIVSESFGLLLQVLLLWTSVDLVFSDGNIPAALELFAWCCIAAFYLLVTCVVLNIVVRLGRPDPKSIVLLISNPVTRVLSSVLTFGSSLIGLKEAGELIIRIGKNEHDALFEVSAVLAMLLSWSLFNWGYARIYYGRYHRASSPPLVFPGSEAPTLVDFVYMSFTNATSFGLPDIQILTSRMRWTVVWHSTFAFFFNSIIIVLSINVVTNTGFFAALLG